jgi:hypothetical protein
MSVRESCVSVGMNMIGAAIGGATSAATTAILFGGNNVVLASTIGAIGSAIILGGREIAHRVGGPVATGVLLGATAGGMIGCRVGIALWSGSRTGGDAAAFSMARESVFVASICTTLAAVAIPNRVWVMFSEAVFNIFQPQHNHED